MEDPSKWLPGMRQECIESAVLVVSCRFESFVRDLEDGHAMGSVRWP